MTKVFFRWNFHGIDTLGLGLPFEVALDGKMSWEREKLAASDVGRKTKVWMASNRGIQRSFVQCLCRPETENTLCGSGTRVQSVWWSGSYYFRRNWKRRRAWCVPRFPDEMLMLWSVCVGVPENIFPGNIFRESISAEIILNPILSTHIEGYFQRRMVQCTFVWVTNKQLFCVHPKANKHFQQLINYSSDGLLLICIIISRKKKTSRSPVASVIFYRYSFLFEVREH